MEPFERRKKKNRGPDKGVWVYPAWLPHQIYGELDYVYDDDVCDACEHNFAEDAKVFFCGPGCHIGVHLECALAHLASSECGRLNWFLN